MSVDHGKIVFLVLLDLSGAFDKVDHNILSSWLENMFIGQNIKCVLMFYLCYLEYHSVHFFTISVCNGVLAQPNRVKYYLLF